MVLRRWLRPGIVAGALGAGVAVALVLAHSTSRAEGPHASAVFAATPGTTTEFALPTASRVPEAIVAGPDGNLWFTEYQAGAAIGRITPSGTVTEFAITTPNSGAFWITVGPDGNLWFTEGSANKIGKMSPAGAMLGEFALPTVNSGPSNIVAGPDGNLWFTELNGNAIGRITTAGVPTEVAHLSAGAGPTGIVVGPDGNLWFTEQYANKIGKVTTAGTVTEVALAAGRTPANIAAGSDANLWFTEFDGNRIGKITTAGSVTEFAVPTASSQPGSIAAGIDGNLWFTEQSGNNIGRIKPDGTITEFGPIPTAGSGPGGIAPGPDGNLWFTERIGNKIGRQALSCNTWTGAVDGNFGTAGNWSSGAVPGAADDACIIATTTTVPPAKADTYTVLLNGNFSIHSLALGGPNSTQTLVIPANNVGLTLASGTTSTINTNGVLTLGSTGTGYSLLGGAGATLTNSGHLNTTPVATGGASRYVRSNLVNAASGTVDIAGYTLEDAYNGDTTTTNNGSFTVEASGSLVLTPGPTNFASFTNAGGSVTNSGTFSESGGRFTQRGGTESGNAVVLTGGATLDDDTSAGAARFLVTGASLASIMLTGTGPNPGVAAGQVVTIAGTNAAVKFLVSLTNAGTIVVGDNSGSGYSLLSEDQNGLLVLTNTGHVNFVAGGLRYLRVNLVNAAGGTVDVAAADTRQDGNNNGSPPNGPVTSTTNNGTFTVEAGGAFGITGGSSFANGGGVTNNGAFSLTGGRFTQRGTESGNAIVIADNSTLDDDLSAGAGLFTLTTGFSYGDTLTGTGPNPGIAAGQVVTLASQDPAHPHDYTLATSFTNAGTLNLGDPGTGTGPSVLAGAALTNTGHLNTIVGGGGYRYLRLNVTNSASGVFDIAATTVMDLNGRSFTNHGTLTLETTGTLALGNGATFAQDAAGTFATTIDANATKFGQLNGGAGSVTLDGLLKVTTVGKPAVGSSWPIISNANRSGMFAGHDFGYWNYDTQYHATDVTLVAQATCDVWIGGVDNNFGTAANWSLGTVPTSTDDACINATTTTIVHATADTYTVLVNGDFPVKSLTLGGPNGAQTLAIPSTSRLTLLGNSSINARGVMVLGDAGNADAWLGCVPACSATGPTLTNNGTLKTIQGGGGTRHIQVMVINAPGAMLDIGGVAAQTDAGCNSPGGISNNRAIINNGNVTVEANADFTPSCGFVNNAGATVANNGVFRMWGDAFVQRGTESGNPVTFTNGSGIDDDLSAGPGSFVYSGSAGYPSGQVSLTGTGPHPGIPAGQIITIASTNTYIGIYPNMTNAGTIILGDNSGTGDSGLCCAYFTSGATITNTGTIKTVQGSGGIRHLQVNVANLFGGIIDIAADTRQDQACGTGGVNATTITNGGTFTIEASGHYAMSNCPPGGYQNTFTQGAGGTFQTTVDANATTFGQLTGGAVNLDGKLRVTTVGWPSLSSTWPIISGAIRSGSFAGFDICGPDYNVEYALTSVTLAVRANLYTTQSVTQERLSNSDGSTWWDMDPGQLSLTFTPTADSYAVMSGNADLWTSLAGYNQDLGISVSGPGQSVYPTVVGQPEAWKESGGFAGTFSPNAAFVQTVVFLKQGQPYTVKLVWKANKNAPGATIWAGAGPIGNTYSPTRLAVQLLPASSSNVKSAMVTGQPVQVGSDGSTWKDLDPGLSFQYTPCVNGQALLSGNVDLWTSVARYNQDVGISVTGGVFPTTPAQPEVWKESGGFAGTFSPNAAFVQGAIPLTANTTYTFKLTWKANTPSPASAAIWAGAGPIGSQYSPTRLMLQFVPTGGSVSRVLDATSTAQYIQNGSNGASWVDMDVASATPLTLQLSSPTSCVAVLTANADLWTSVAGYNQDIGITVSGPGQTVYPTVAGQPEAWKESGGFAGTFSPNAAYVQTVLQLAPGVPYNVKVQWKTNIPSPSTAAIYTGAGPITTYSPTRLTAQLLGCS